MKKFSVLFVSFLSIGTTYVQSQSLLGNENGNVSLIDTTTKRATMQVTNPNSVTLLGGSMNPVKGGNVILPKTNKPALPLAVPTLQVPYAPKNANTVTTITTDPPKSKYKTIVKQSNNAASLTDNNFQSLTDDNNNKPLTSSYNSSSNQNSYNTQLAPLTDDAVKPLTATTNAARKSAETVDPSLMSLTGNVKKNTTQTTQTVAKSSIPALAPIDNAQVSSNNYSTPKYKMPALASIETKGNTASNASKSSMPELAPIEGQTTTTTASKTAMPELAPIEDENAAKAAAQANKVKTNLRGLIMPTGTTMKATNTKSFIFKPTAQVDEPKDNGDEQISSKPSAGGGIGMPALAPIVEDSKKKDIIPELAPIELSTEVAATPAMPVLAPIQEKSTIQQEQYKQAQVNQQQQQPAQPARKTNYQTQQQLLQAAKNHQHDPNNPCCQVQMYKAPATKKTVAKKPVYRKKRVYRQPTVVYVYEQEPQQPQTVERIVYVPAPKQQQPQQQQSKPIQQPQQNVIYRDYTNAYKKADPQPVSTPCNCPNTNQSSTQYKSNNAAMNYAFYLNPRGKYSVGVFNNNSTIIISQDGKFKEYKINDASIDPNTYRPKLNSYGYPESIAGVPIEYNYNTTVHKVGNVVFTYDFEDYFKTVGNSNVNYTSRSSLASVDGINVHYDDRNNVISVDPNNGLIQFNP